MGKNTEWAVSRGWSLEWSVGVEPGGGVRGWSLGHGQTWAEPEAAGDSKSEGAEQVRRMSRKRACPGPVRRVGRAWAQVH